MIFRIHYGAPYERPYQYVVEIALPYWLWRRLRRMRWL